MRKSRALPMSSQFAGFPGAEMSDNYLQSVLSFLAVWVIYNTSLQGRTVDSGAAPLTLLSLLSHAKMYSLCGRLPGGR